MNRKKLIPLLLFLLLLLVILCVWCHSADILKNRTINLSQVNTTTSGEVATKEIDFSFVKVKNKIELRGNFSKQESVNKLHTSLSQTKVNNFSIVNEKLIEKEGVISLTEKLLIPFNEKYRSGSVSYSDNKLTVEGIVDTDADKNAVSALLANSTINSENNTYVVISEQAKQEANAKAKKRS